MDIKLQKWFSEFAQCAGANIGFPETLPVQVSGMEDGEPRTFSIRPDQPESDLIFEILCAIGHFAFLSGNPKPWPIPWWLNRPYENEFLGEMAYKIRRGSRQVLNLKWQTNLWAMAVYCQLGCHKQFGLFLKRHPDKTKMLLILWYGVLVSPSVQKLRTCCRILFCFLAAKVAASNT